MNFVNFGTPVKFWGKLLGFFSWPLRAFFEKLLLPYQIANPYKRRWPKKKPLFRSNTRSDYNSHKLKENKKRQKSLLIPEVNTETNKKTINSTWTKVVLNIFHKLPLKVKNKGTGNHKCPGNPGNIQSSGKLKKAKIHRFPRYSKAV